MAVGYEDSSVQQVRNPLHPDQHHFGQALLMSLQHDQPTPSSYALSAAPSGHDHHPHYDPNNVALPQSKTGPNRRRPRTKPGTCVPVVPFDKLPNVGPISLENPYSCPVCRLEFYDKSKFRNHYMVHTGEQPYGCRWCPFRARQLCNLKTHVREKHRVDPHGLQEALQDPLQGSHLRTDFQ